jgi:hypothetical protein
LPAPAAPPAQPVEASTLAGLGNKFGNNLDEKCLFATSSAIGKPLKHKPFSYLNHNWQVIGSSPIIGSTIHGVFAN